MGRVIHHFKGINILFIILSFLLSTQISLLNVIKYSKSAPLVSIYNKTVTRTIFVRFTAFQVIQLHSVSIICWRLYAFQLISLKKSSGFISGYLPTRNCFPYGAGNWTIKNLITGAVKCGGPLSCWNWGYSFLKLRLPQSFTVLKCVPVLRQTIDSYSLVASVPAWCLAWGSL